MYKEKIDAYIDAHKQEMIEDICVLCRINSERMPAEEGMPYGPGAAECLDAALDLAEGYGFEVVDYDGYVGCIDFDSTLPKQLDILAHLDVVPAGSGWTVTGPFSPIVKDGRLYGRGTADDKGPAVAALYAMRAVKELGIPLKKNVRLILGTDEECGSSDIAHYYAKEKEAPMTFSPDGEYPVINVEKGRLPGHFTARFAASDALPRLLEIQAGTKINVVPGTAYAVAEGLGPEVLAAAVQAVEAETGVRFSLEQEGACCRISAVGTGAHASTPGDGNNAITALLVLLDRLPFAPCRQMEVLKSLSVLYPHGDLHGTALGVDMEDEVSGRITLVLSMLKMTKDNLDGEFDTRVPVCGNETNVLEVIRGKMAGQGITLLNETMDPPHQVKGDSPFIQTLLSVYEDYTGLPGKCISIGGSTYVHHLENGVAFGAAMPGTDNKMHGADESAVLEELFTSAKIFANVIVGLCG